ncbi:MAG: hypothetical protein WD738_14795 [Pirellulales bacterium]
MSIRIGWLALLGVCAVGANAVQAQIDGINDNPRVFNDFSTTTLVYVNGNSVNQGPILSSVLIDETAWTDDGMGGSFANRHDFTLSSDGGATSHTFGIDDSYTVKTLVNLSAGSNAPRKEAGLRINSPITGDALFLVNSDAGEIVAFGGGAPFFSFSSGAQPDYVPGTTILLGFTMLGNGVAANTMEYFIDRMPGVPGGEVSSGPLPFSNLEEGPLAYNVALYSQASPNLANSAEFVSTDFTDIMFMRIPEPATVAIGLIGMLGVFGFMRRR